mmetsp:Transcript_17105/g.29587  ORF Transcript_17105/g.29587 Transcript_17105/m.29587 type:complete len:221 (+) Transcript_17105:310-972(+)
MELHPLACPYSRADSDGTVAGVDAEDITDEEVGAVDVLLELVAAQADVQRVLRQRPLLRRQGLDDDSDSLQCGHVVQLHQHIALGLCHPQHIPDGPTSLSNDGADFDVARQGHADHAAALQLPVVEHSASADAAQLHRLREGVVEAAKEVRELPGGRVGKHDEGGHGVGLHAARQGPPLVRRSIEVRELALRHVECTNVDSGKVGEGKAQRGKRFDLLSP